MNSSADNIFVNIIIADTAIAITNPYRLYVRTKKPSVSSLLYFFTADKTHACSNKFCIVDKTVGNLYATEINPFAAIPHIYKTI